MRRMIGLLALPVMLSACGKAEEAGPTPAPSASVTSSITALPEPDLAACPKAKPNPDLQRIDPVPVPAAFGKLAKSSMDHFAVVTADGSTACVDTTWIEAIDDAKASSDNRFLAFSWVGYEAYGYVLIDRSGKGQVIDTGNDPLSPPSGHRFASIELTESGFGSLNAFAVWDILPIGLKQIAEVSEGLPGGDWRVDGWQGDDCVRISHLPNARFPDNFEDLDEAPRDPWFASKANGWVPSRGSCPKA